MATSKSKVKPTPIDCWRRLIRQPQRSVTVHKDSVYRFARPSFKFRTANRPPFWKPYNRSIVLWYGRRIKSYTRNRSGWLRADDWLVQDPDRTEFIVRSGVP